MTGEINHTQFYAKAKYYDIAFNFKNVAEESQTLIDVYKKYCGRDPKSFLDIAAGPASNAVEMAKRGITSSAIDFSHEMVAYGIESSKKAGVSLHYTQGDMRSFVLPQKVDLAAIFMDSTSYLITNDDFISHLKSVSNSLSQDGIYILEMSHPRDVFSVGKSASTEWDCEENDVKVSVKWGDETDEFDPISQTTLITARLQYKSAADSGEIVDQCLQRCFSFNEVEALVRASGCFEMIDVLGSLKPKIKFSNEKSSWRMVPVLRKK